MNHLQEVAEQVEEFGTFITTNSDPNFYETTHIYKLDGTTKVHIVYDKNSNLKSVTFLHGAN